MQIMNFKGVEIYILGDRGFERKIDKEKDRGLRVQGQRENVGWIFRYIEREKGVRGFDIYICIYSYMGLDREEWRKREMIHLRLRV